jgi:hypothetical protein
MNCQFWRGTAEDWVKKLPGLGKGTFKPGRGNFQAWVRELPGLVRELPGLV